MSDAPQTTPPPMTTEQRARLAYQTIEAFGWSIQWRSDKPVPDDAWPIDIIQRAIEAGIDDAEEAERIANTCDEPACERQASCGFPLPGGGYSRTCHEHGKALANYDLPYEPEAGFSPVEAPKTWRGPYPSPALPEGVGGAQNASLEGM